MSGSLFAPEDTFVRRHLGSSRADVKEMLASLGYGRMDDLVVDAVPGAIRLERPLAIDPLGLGREPGEREALERLASLAAENRPLRSYLGLGYHGAVMPGVIQRNILENPGWYTQYTPYQAEISQGRLEALLNFQTMVAELTGLPFASASLLDEATAAAEAMHLAAAVFPKLEAIEHPVFFVDAACHPQTIAVVKTRARAVGIEVFVGDPFAADYASGRIFGVLVQYPTSDGRVIDYAPLAERVHEAKALLVAAADPLALALLRPPGEFGADVAIGSTQRFGLPMGYGGPHAAYLATRDEYKRQMPGRIIGVSKDSAGRAAFRMALQTREQHIRREKATSNICTAQVLPAILASMWAVYHGAEGVRRIAERVHRLAAALVAAARSVGHAAGEEPYFDTVRIDLAGATADEVVARALDRGINLRKVDETTVVVALDETVEREDFEDLLAALGAEGEDAEAFASAADAALPDPHARKSAFLTHPVFSKFHTEHEMLRYIKRLESRDLSLVQSMIPLGSCTMKLNATAEMAPLSWPGLAELHPFVPAEQARGYRRMMDGLEDWLGEITGFHAVSLQPNAGSQGEYTGLLVIRAYHEARGESRRDVCLIPVSAHGTNPASAVMAGLKVVPVACDERGNIDVADLAAKAEANASRLAALMVTYPSTHGVFEEAIREICAVVHRFGGQVYLDG
ncbi:MAG: aminomethyl-transferring glycine dehydrogenase, partial [Acidobacteria bacterium]|nr:aminomethyl-transferring glycine dehydrogenase [Acidobacteriota bacterium]